MVSLPPDLPEKIKDALLSCSDQERSVLMKILEELSETGDSETYSNIWTADYKEIPVSIDTFIESEKYLGCTNKQGSSVYPEWRTVLRDIFNSGNKYNEIVFTGATRIGKTSTAITATAYMLYKLMCLKSPQEFFGKKDISKFSVLFFNITKDLAKGVAFREFNDTLKESPWFNAHGTFSDSEKNYYYIPEGGKIDIDYGSSASHGLGKQIYCLLGSTVILTEDGSKTLEELWRCGHSCRIAQYSGEDIVYSDANVSLTKHVDETIRVTLDDGSVIEGTKDHLVMLSDGTYKKLGDLTNLDDLLTLNI